MKYHLALHGTSPSPNSSVKPVLSSAGWEEAGRSPSLSPERARAGDSGGEFASLPMRPQPRAHTHAESCCRSGVWRRACLEGRDGAEVGALRGSDADAEDARTWTCAVSQDVTTAMHTRSLALSFSALIKVSQPPSPFHDALTTRPCSSLSTRLSSSTTTLSLTLSLAASWRVRWALMMIESDALPDDRSKRVER